MKAHFFYETEKPQLASYSTAEIANYNCSSRNLDGSTDKTGTHGPQKHNLTYTDGDVITLYAVWEPDRVGITVKYVETGNAGSHNNAISDYTLSVKEPNIDTSFHIVSKNYKMLINSEVTLKATPKADEVITYKSMHSDCPTYDKDGWWKNSDGSHKIYAENQHSVAWRNGNSILNYTITKDMNEILTGTSTEKITKEILSEFPISVVSATLSMMWNQNGAANADDSTHTYGYATATPGDTRYINAGDGWVGNSETSINPNHCIGKISLNSEGNNISGNASHSALEAASVSVTVKYSDGSTESVPAAFGSIDLTEFKYAKLITKIY